MDRQREEHSIDHKGTSLMERRTSIDDIDEGGIDERIDAQSATKLEGRTFNNNIDERVKIEGRDSQSTTEGGTLISTKEGTYA